MTPGCTTSIVDRQVTLRLSQDGDRVIGTATFPTGPPAGSCTFVDSGGQPHTFTWESLSDQVGWFEARPGDGVSVEGRVSGDRLDLGGLRLRQASETEASAAIDLAPYDVSGELTVRLRRESRSPPSDA